MTDGQTNTAKSLLIVVCDLSADKHVAKLLPRLKERDPNIRLWGIGGPAMAEQGFEELINLRAFTVVGIIESIKFFPTFLRWRKELADQVARNKPDAVMLVDAGGFNLFLAKALRKRFPALPILYFISPQVWGSRPWRINDIKKTITKMLVIFPFEETLYHSRGIEARFVGHPLMSNLPSVESVADRDGFCRLLDLDSSKHIVGVFPGSRKREITMHMPVVAQAIEMLLAQRDDVQLVISAHDAEVQAMIDAALKSCLSSPDRAQRIRIVGSERNYELMANADMLWAKSGTTTLEAAMFNRPMFIFYRANLLSFVIFLIFKRVKHVGWPNLLAGEYLVPELIQLDCRAELFVRYTCDYLDAPGLRKEVSEKLAALRSQLGQGEYTSNCAVEIFGAINLISQSL